MLIFFNEILNTVQSDIKIIVVNLQMNPTIGANFFAFVHELLDSPLYVNITSTFGDTCLPNTKNKFTVIYLVIPSTLRV